MNPLFMFFFLVITVFVVLVVIYKSNKNTKKELINELWKNKEISDDTYKKYLDN